MKRVNYEGIHCYVIHSILVLILPSSAQKAHCLHTLSPNPLITCSSLKARDQIHTQIKEVNYRFIHLNHYVLHSRQGDEILN